MAAMNLGRIELARGGGAFAHMFIVGGGVGLRRGLGAEAFATAARRLFGAMKPPQAETEHDQRRHDAEAGRGKRRGAEERHRNGVLDRRGARQR
jgi:hypothetical protein